MTKTLVMFSNHRTDFEISEERGGRIEYDLILGKLNVHCELVVKLRQ